MTIFQLSDDVVQTPHATHQHTQHDHTRHERSLFTLFILYVSVTRLSGLAPRLCYWNVFTELFRWYNLFLLWDIGRWALCGIVYKRSLSLACRRDWRRGGSGRKGGGSEPILQRTLISLLDTVTFINTRRFASGDLCHSWSVYVFLNYAHRWASGISAN